MTVAHTTVLEMLGKEVSFCWLGADGITYHTDGQLTSIAFHLDSSFEFKVDEGDYFSFDEITDFKLL